MLKAVGFSKAAVRLPFHATGLLQKAVGFLQQKLQGSEVLSGALLAHLPFHT